jgi:hypothetical protein
VQPHAVALMDATDLPAACSGFKKKYWHLYRRARGIGWAHAQDRAEPLVRRLQETHAAFVAAHGPSDGDVVAAGQLADARQCGRGGSVGAQPAVVCAQPGLVAGADRRRHGLSWRPRASRSRANDTRRRW